MIETVIIRELSGALRALGEECPVVAEEPANAPERFVLVEKTGSGLVNRIGSATFAVQTYAMTLYEAAALCDTVKTAMLDTVLCCGEIAGIRLRGDYNFTDTETRRYRYQAVFDVTFYP